MRDDMTDEEIERGKSQMRAGILMAQESVSGMTDSMARQLLLFGHVRTLPEVAASVASLTKEDVVRVIERFDKASVADLECNWP